MQVKDLMTENPYHVSATDSAEKAVRLMNNLKIRHLLVVDRGILVGIVSINDFPIYMKPQLTIYNVMTPNPITIQSNETVERAEEIMLSNELRSLPVLENKNIVGIITMFDLQKRDR